MNKHYDCIIIGAGPGGYVAAIRLGQLEKKVAIIEKENPGGVCLNCGCIPSKTLIYASKLYKSIKKAGTWGINASLSGFDMPILQDKKRGIIEKLQKGILQLLSANNVEYIEGFASFVEPYKISVKNQTEEIFITADNIIIATGTVPYELPSFPFDNKKILNSTDILSVSEIPSSIIIIGGGVIGMEMACLFANLGTKITVIEFMENILPGIDTEIAKTLERFSKRLKIDIHTSSQAVSYQENTDGLLEVLITKKEENFTLTAEKVLVTVGRKANIEGLNIEKAGLNLSQDHHIKVGNDRQTDIKNIYAIGDITSVPYLAHKASRDALISANAITRKNYSHLLYKEIPSAIFTDPEISTIGISEAFAEKNNIQIKTMKFPFAALGRSQASGEIEGFIKLIAGKNNDHILGVHIIGPNASDLIGEASLCIKKGLTVEDLAETIHPHPTFCEIIGESAEALLETPIHILPEKKE